MKELKENSLMNLPSEIKLSLANGRYSLYILSKTDKIRATYLLATSYDDTFFVSQEGDILGHAGKLGENKVEDVVKFSDTSAFLGAKINIA